MHIRFSYIMTELEIYGVNLVKQIQLFSEEGTTIWGLKGQSPIVR